MDLPEFPRFADIGLDLMEEVCARLKRHPLEASEYTFTNFFAYRDRYTFQVASLRGNMIVLSESRPSSFFCPVGSSAMEDTLAELFRFGQERYGTDCLVRVPRSFLEQHLAGSSVYAVHEDRDHFDYLYRVSDLIQLKGRAYHDKKNKVNKFRSSYPYTYLPLTEDLLDECLEFEDYWCEVRECEKYFGLNQERCAILEMLTNFRVLNLRGGVIRIDGKIAALTIGEKFLDDTLVIHIEKAHADIPGLYQVINQEFLMHEGGDCSLVNREQDLGIEGLRKSKLSYNPVGFVKKYRVSAERGRGS